MRFALEMPGERRPVRLAFFKERIPTLDRFFSAVGQASSLTGEELLAD